MPGRNTRTSPASSRNARATALATRPAFKTLVDVTPQAQFSVSDETKALLSDLAARDVTLRIDTFYARLPGARTPEESALIGIQGRKIDLEGCTLPHFAVTHDITPVILDNPVNHRQTQTAAFTDVFRCVKRFVYSIQRCLVHPRAVVADI